MLAAFVSILRPHIIAIAMAACVVFGWLFTRDYPWAVAGLAGLDWLLINLLNKVSDVGEDRHNAVAGTGFIERRRGALLAGWLALQFGSQALGWLVAPELLGWRLAVQIAGVGYSYRILPTPRGGRRFKDLYFLKNFMSALLFVATVMVYPVAAAGWRLDHPAGWRGVGVLALFFVAFEITYEILYDLRDLQGDRREGIPTFPVVHGEAAAQQIVDGLLAMSGALLLAGFLGGVLGVRELLFAAAPAAQLAFYKRRVARGLTAADCVALTNLGTALLVLFVAGTAAWNAAGLPENIYIT